jgi:uncharacterized RDD family membrane protein YckC
MDIVLERASAGKRLLNLIIDSVVFYMLVFGFGMALGLLFPSFAEASEPETLSFKIVDRLISAIFYALYMGSLEVIFRGKSFGKFLTGTKAVNLDGSEISKTTAFQRGFSRAVPFCAFSALGSPCNPWQDRWTDTMVIDEKESQ